MNFHKQFCCFYILPYVNKDLFLSVITRISATSHANILAQPGIFNKYYDRYFREFHEANGIYISDEEIEHCLNSPKINLKCSTLIKKEIGNTDLCKHCQLNIPPNYFENTFSMENQFVYRITHSSLHNGDLIKSVNPNDYQCPIIICIIRKNQFGDIEYEIKSCFVLTKILSYLKSDITKTERKSKGKIQPLFNMDRDNFSLEYILEIIDKSRSLGKYSQEFNAFYKASLKKYLCEIFQIHEKIDLGASPTEKAISEIKAQKKYTISQKYFTVFLDESSANNTDCNIEKRRPEEISKLCDHTFEPNKTTIVDSTSYANTESTEIKPINVENSDINENKNFMFPEISNEKNKITFNNLPQELRNQEPLFPSELYLSWKKNITQIDLEEKVIFVDSSDYYLQLLSLLPHTDSIAIECVLYQKKNGKISPSLLVKVWDCKSIYLLSERPIISSFMEMVAGNNSILMITTNAINLSWLCYELGHNHIGNIYSLSALNQVIYPHMDWINSEQILNLFNIEISKNGIINILSALFYYQKVCDFFTLRSKQIRPFSRIKIYISWELFMGNSRHLLSRYESGGLKYELKSYNAIPYKMGSLTLYNHNKGIIIMVSVILSKKSQNELSKLIIDELPIYILGKLYTIKLLRETSLSIVDYQNHNYIFFNLANNKNTIIQVRMKLAESIRLFYFELGISIERIDLKSDRYD